MKPLIVGSIKYTLKQPLSYCSRLCGTSRTTPCLDRISPRQTGVMGQQGLWEDLKSEVCWTQGGSLEFLNSEMNSPHDRFNVMKACQCHAVSDTIHIYFQSFHHHVQLLHSLQPGHLWHWCMDSDLYTKPPQFWPRNLCDPGQEGHPSRTRSAGTTIDDYPNHRVCHPPFGHRPSLFSWVVQFSHCYHPQPQLDKQHEYIHIFFALHSPQGRAAP